MKREQPTSGSTCFSKPGRPTKQVIHNVRLPREGVAMQYITFMHGNVDTEPTKEEWERFFELASESGCFRGGSAMGKRSTVGE
jgi:hypothetical protein